MEDKYSEAIAWSIQLDGQITILWLKLQSIKGRVEVAKEKVTAAEMVVRLAKAEVARVVEDYKKFADFEDEVIEVARDADQKGFAKCKRKVAQAFHLLDLSKIRPYDLEEAEEEEAIGNKGKAIEAKETSKVKMTMMPPEES